MADGFTSGARRFLSLAADGSNPNSEQNGKALLARARAFLAVAALLAINIDTVHLGRSAGTVYALLLLYLVHSLLALVGLRYRSWNLHVIDVLWTSTIPLLIPAGNISSFLFCLFLLFILFSAAYLWGVSKTLITAAVCIPSVLVGTMLASSGGWQNLHSPTESELSGFFSRVVFLLAAAYVVGLVGEGETRFQLRSLVAARVRAGVLAAANLSEALETALGAILVIADADRAVLAVCEERTQQAFFWEARLVPGTAKSAAHWEDLEFFQHQRYFFPLPGASCAMRSKQSGQAASSFDVLALGAGGEPLPKASLVLPDYFLSWYRPSSLVVLSVSVGEDQSWFGRLFVFDPPIAKPGEAGLRFLHDLVSEIAPAVYEFYRVRRLRSRAGALVRARLARELHDDVIQGLIGMELRVDVLRRKATSDSALAGELGQFQRLLRQEILNVRDLIQRSRALDLTSRTPWQNLGELVEKFERHTGIHVELTSESEHVPLRPGVAREVLQIVGEALANIRKHSGAQHVRVRIFCRQERWQLIIEDDGRGFDFAGRWSQAKLDANRKGPAVIKERVRSLGGDLVVESTPNCGSRIEISFPQQAK